MRVPSASRFEPRAVHCATGGLIIRELELLEKYLPKTGKDQNVEYDIVWKNFTSALPLTDERVANKLDAGSNALRKGLSDGRSQRRYFLLATVILMTTLLQSLSAERSPADDSLRQRKSL